MALSVHGMEKCLLNLFLPFKIREKKTITVYRALTMDGRGEGKNAGCDNFLAQFLYEKRNIYSQTNKQKENHQIK